LGQPNTLLASVDEALAAHHYRRAISLADMESVSMGKHTAPVGKEDGETEKGKDRDKVKEVLIQADKTLKDPVRSSPA
jgi:hypothetical protein